MIDITIIFILVLNVLALSVMALAGSDENVESRTEREKDILNKNK